MEATKHLEHKRVWLKVWLNKKMVQKITTIKDKVKPNKK